MCVFLYSLGTCTVDFQMHIIVPAKGLLGGVGGGQVEGDCLGVRGKLSSPGRICFGAGMGHWPV